MIILAPVLVFLELIRSESSSTENGEEGPKETLYLNSKFTTLDTTYEILMVAGNKTIV